MSLELRATAYFHDPRPFLQAFATKPAAALAHLEADPKAFGPRHVGLSTYGRERAYKSLLAAARKQVRTLSHAGNRF